MSSRTLPTTSRQQPPAAVAAMSRRRFWANLVVQVSGLLAMLVVAASPALVQAQPGVSIELVALELTEGSDSKDYGVWLNSAPTGMVSVTVAVSDEDAGLELDKTVLMFGQTGWNIAQRVTVTAMRDGLYIEERRVTLKHIVQGANYADVLADDVVVIILNNDDDEPKPTEIRLSLDREPVIEGELAILFEVTATLVGGIALNQATEVTVTIEEDLLAARSLLSMLGVSDDSEAAEFGGDFTRVPKTDSTITIPAGKVGGSVVVSNLSVVEDIVPEGSELLFVTGTAEGFTVSPTTLQIDDNDPTSVRINSEDMVGEAIRGDVLEGGIFTYTVGLRYYPHTNATVTVMVEVTGGEDFVENLSELETTLLTFHNDIRTFSRIRSPTPQIVEVKTKDNSDYGDSPKEVTLAHRVVRTDDHAYRGLQADTVVLTITDNDRAGIRISPARFFDVSEGDSAGITYYVQLLSRPPAGVEVEVMMSVSEGDADLIELDPSTLSLNFTAANWDTPLSVTVTPRDNDDSAPDQRVTITHTVSSNDSEYLAQAREQPQAEIEVGLLIREDDGIPTEIILTLNLSSGSEGSIFRQLEITASWKDDAVPGTETHVDLRLNHEDDINSLGLGADEVAGGKEYSLSREQMEQWNLLIIDAGASEGVEGPFRLEINDDDIDENDEYIVLGGTTNIRGVTVSPTLFLILDDDDSGVRFTLFGSTAGKDAGAALGEGAEFQYFVELESEPTDRVTVTVSVAGDEGYDQEITIRANAEENRPLDSGEDLTKGGVLIFTSENWNQTQTVTAVAENNDYYRGYLEVILTHTAEGGDGAYDDLPATVITLGITENDEPPTGIELSLHPTEVGEGSGTVFVTVEAVLVGGTLGAETTVLLRTNHRDDIVGVPTLALQGQGGFDYMDGGEIALVIPRSRVHMGVEFPLTVLQDRIDEDDETIVFGGTVTGYFPELDITLDIMTAGLKITDDDEPGLVFLPPTGRLSVPEGDTSAVGKTYSVALTSQPAGPVTVNLSVVAGREAIEPIPEGLIFLEDEWNVPRDVLITPTPNIHTNDDVLVQIQHVAIGDGYTVSEDYILTIKDDDDAPTQVMVEVAFGRKVTEDGGPQEVTLWIELDGSPYGVATTVDLFIGDGTAEAGTDFRSAHITFGMISGGGNSQLVGDRVTLDIPAGEQVIVVTLELEPLPDDIDEGNETIVFVGEVDGLTGGQATIEILDDEDDVAGIVLSTSSLQVAEGGDAVTYTVRLASRPLGDVVVHINVDLGPSLEIISRIPSSLTFTQEDWNEPKTVEVSAVMDDTRNDIRQLTITLFAESTEDNNDGYFDRPFRELSLELIERSVLISKPSATVAEGGIAEYGVRLTSEPTLPVKVKVSIRDEHRDEIDFLQLVVDDVEQRRDRKLTLTFDDRNWKAYQTVTIQTVDNNYSGTNPPVVIKHTVSSAGDYADVTAENFTLTITDNEVAATSVLLSLNPPAVDEDDGGGIAMVTLTAELDGPARNEDTVVSLTINDPGEELPTGISMEDIAEINVDFTLSDPKSPIFELTIPARMKDTETVLVLNLVNDNVDEGDSETIVISGEVISGDAGLLEVQSAILNINDDDDRGVMVSPIRLTVAEDADPVTYTVKLTSEPAGNDPVMVELSVAYTGVAEDITQDEVLFNGESGPLTLVFGGDSGNPWNEGQDVGVTLTANETIDGARDATIEHSVSGADYNGVTVEDVPMALTDYGVLVSEVVLAVDEGGRSTYTLSLTSAPTDDVTVEIVIPAPYDGVLSAEPTTYTFDAVTWSDGVDVTVTLAGDDLFNEKRVLTIEHRVTASEDPNYEELEVAGVEVTLTDDEEQPGLLLELSRDSSEEGSGDDNTIVDVVATVSLEGALRSEVTRGTLRFGGAPDDTANGGEDYVYQAGILFDIPAEEESVEFSFELGLIGDQIDEDDEFFTITASDDLSNVASARFTIDDDDEAGVAVTLMDQSVREGDEIGYTVVLESQPIADVMVVVTVEEVPDSEAEPGDVTVAVQAPLTLTFNSGDWSRPRDMLLTVKSDLAVFGELEIRHTLISAGDPTYAALPPVSAVLELTDVDVDLSALEVMTAAGDTPDLLDAGGVKIEFSADVTDYFATVPFPDRNASITATPSVIEERPDEQEKGRVRIFRKNGDGTLEALEGGADVAGTATEVNLPEDENTFDFLIEVSARPLPSAAGEEIARQTYTLTLRRALPASAELQVYLADGAGRETPITALDFGPDEDEMSLILILRDDGNIRYSIREVDIRGLVDGFAVPVVGAENPVDFETTVTLSRAEEVDDDGPYSLIFTATPERPMADVNPLSVTIEGTLKANTATRTEIQATYLGEHQDEKKPILPDDAEIRVSDNGTVTIELRVVHSGGGDRPFNQSGFSIATGQADVAAVLMEDGAGYTIEIAPRTDLLSLTVEAVSSLGPRIEDPVDLNFTVSFESPQAVIRAVANPDPLLAFSDPFFAFVGEDNELPLEVVLVGDIPLDDSDRILGGLALTVSLAVGEGDTPKTVAIVRGDTALPDLPGRDLEFAINAPRNSVTVKVVVDGAESEYVEVDNLVFTAHFLSLRHDEDIDFRQDPDPRISKLSLSGEDRSDDSWSFRVVNKAELADDQYEVIEVILAEAEKMISTIITKTVPSDGSTITYTVRTDTVQIVDEVENEPTIGETSPLDEADALSMYEEFAAFAADAERTTITILVDTIEEIYRPFVSGMDAEARLLRVTRLHPDAEDSRIVLKFEYFLDGRSAGVFTRAIDLINGVASNLKVEVTPSVLVVAKGGAPGQVQLVISNLDLEDDPSAPEASIDFRVDPDLVVEPQGEGTIDRINSRFEQTLSVTAAAAADREKYTVVVEVLLPGKRLVRTEFTVDINDAPQYVGDKELTVYESGDNKEAEYRLQIDDSDGGSQFLSADELYLQVIGFGDPSKVMEVGDDYNNGYFKLAFSEIVAVGQEGSANGKPNSLTWTLTLTGVLATPFNSVVQLRLFGVTDGFDGFEQYLTVQVKNRPPQFELAETEGIAVFLEQEPVSIAVVDISGDVTDIVVLEAPDDLVVRPDRENELITLRRLNIDPANDAVAGDPGQVKLAALDAEGGRAEVTIQVNKRPPLLPQIAPQEPLLIPVGEMRTRPLSLEKPTSIDVVTWTVAVVNNPDNPRSFLIGDPEIVVDEDGSVEVSLTISGSAPFGQEFNLRLTAEGGGYEWDALLPVALVAAEPKPRLKLSATVSDKMEFVSSFAFTESLLIGVALEGKVSSSEDLAGATTTSFEIRIVKLNPDGSGESEGDPLILTAEATVTPNDDGLDIDQVPVSVEEIAKLGIDAAGQVVEVSIEHLLDGEVSDTIIVGDSLRLRVSEGPGRVDADNDGLADSDEGDDGPHVLGPITVAVSEVTGGDSGIAASEVSLSLGDAARFLGLGECGRVTLTLSEDEDEDGILTLYGCSSIDRGSQLLSTETVAVLKLVKEMNLELDEGESYQLIDLSATFDSSEANADEPLVISLPFDPRTHGIYRFDRETGEWVQVIDADGPGQPGLDGPGVESAEGNPQSSFYAPDFDRDGSVDLRLLVVPMDLDFALKDASLEGRQLEISAGETETITLVGFEGLTVKIAGAAIDRGNVTGSVSIGDGTVELRGLKRTRNRSEEVLIEAFDDDVSKEDAVASITLYVRVPNQPPKITFGPEKGKELSLLLLPSGERTTTTILDPTEDEKVLLALAPNTKMVLLVMIEDEDDDISFELKLMGDGRGVARPPLGSYFRGLDDDSGEAIIEHELTLSSMGIGAGRFEVSVLVTDLSDVGADSKSVATLFGCVLNDKNQCPAAPRSGGGGGGTGLLWLLFAAPAALCRLTRLRQRLAAKARRASP